jgi:hypothetical protein
MRLVVTDAAAALIHERGGRLYVWPKRAACCGGVTRLATATNAPRREFRLVAATGEVELLFPVGLARMPAELHLDVARFPLRVEAYWDGCAWVT